MNKLSRREFLRISTLATAATVAAACGAPSEPAGPTVAAPAAPPPAEPAAGTSPTQAPAAPPPAVEGQAKFKEAPMLADLVAAGDLPPVDERIPANPCVCPTHEGIGNYGGTMRRAFRGMSDRNGPSKVIAEGFTWYNQDLTVRANMIESWEINEDASVWTVRLRPGTKWSDGAPLTTANMMWYHEHQVMNGELTLSPANQWSTGSPKVAASPEAVDDFTAVVTFADPKPLWAFDMTRFAPITPNHYVEQFHIDFADKDALVAAATAAGLETWMDWFNDRNNWSNNIERPNVGPWIPTNTLDNELFVMERNPYFWQVDSDGQQLPYIDRVQHRLYESPDVFNLWIVSGEIDFQARDVSIANYTLFKESEEAGGYRVFLGASASHRCMQCNLTTKNPRLREFFNKREVRQAFMYAVDRDEMNELVFDGLAKPRQYSPLEQSPQYYETLSTSHILYDPDLANQLLDEAGYAERGADGYRVWPDGSGEPISFMIEGTAAAGTPDEDAVNMLGTYHDAIGIKTNYRYSERSLYTEHFEANEIEAAFWGGDRTVLPIVAPFIFVGVNADRPWACAWALYRNSNGTNPNGEEPPEGHWIWDIWDNWEKILLEPDDAVRNDLFRNIMDIWVEEIPQIGYLGQFPAPIIVKNGFKGYLNDQVLDDTTEDEHLLNPQSYYWDDPAAHA
jgi:peptide/nickel transport system substrate-binding protein